jgi:hypothetical protein
MVVWRRIPNALELRFALNDRYKKVCWVKDHNIQFRVRDSMKLFSIILMLGMLVFASRLTVAQQLTCTPSVTPAACKQFDEGFGHSTLWPNVNFTKGVDIVVVDPVQFKAERAKFDAEKETLAKNKKTVGDINRINAREAGNGVFEYEILECPTSSLIKRVVISTDAIGESVSYTIHEISDQLLFYVIGYDQGLVQGMSNSLP